MERLPHGDVNQGPHLGFQRSALVHASCGLPRSLQPAPPFASGDVPGLGRGGPSFGVIPSQA